MTIVMERRNEVIWSLSFWRGSWAGSAPIKIQGHGKKKASLGGAAQYLTFIQYRVVTILSIQFVNEKAGKASPPPGSLTQLGLGQRVAVCKATVPKVQVRKSTDT
jgi:hypothetical protein